jgi:hypothetical protein
VGSFNAQSLKVSLGFANRRLGRYRRGLFTALLRHRAIRMANIEASDERKAIKGSGSRQPS